MKNGFLLLIVIVAGVLLAPVLIAVLFYATYAIAGVGGFLLLNADSSCHNVMRGFKTSASPVVSSQISIEISQINDLRRITQTFAEEQGWSFVSGRYTPYGSEISYSACTEPGVTLRLRESPFDQQGVVVDPDQWSGMVTVSLFVEEHRYDWMPEYRIFIDALEGLSEVQHVDDFGRVTNTLEQAARARGYTNPDTLIHETPAD